IEVFRAAFGTEHQRLGASAGRGGQRQRGDRKVLAVFGQFHTRLLLEWDSALAETNIIGRCECGKTRLTGFNQDRGQDPLAGFGKPDSKNCPAKWQAASRLSTGSGSGRSARQRSTA